MSRLRLEKPWRGHVAMGLDQQTLSSIARDSDGLARVVSRNWRDDPDTAVRYALRGCEGLAHSKSVNLIVAGDLALHWLQIPPPSYESFEELQLVAQARCAHLFGLSEADWWVTGDWHASRPFVCVALPLAVTAPLQQSFAQLGLIAKWHTAWGLLCASQHHAFPSNGWSAVRTPSRVQLWHCSNGNVDALATLPGDPGEDKATAVSRALQQMRIEASRAERCVIGTLHWLDLTSSHSQPAPVGTECISVGAILEMADGGCSEAAAALSLQPLLKDGTT